MLESHPSPSPGTVFGFLLIASLLFLDLGLVLLIANEPITLLSFLWGLLLLASIAVIAFVGFWTSILAATRYQVDGDVLVIQWGRIRQALPLEQIQRLVTGEAITSVKRFRGVRWPGYFVGHGYVSSEDGRIVDCETIFYATRPLQRQLLLVTESVAYALSPVDLSNFTDCLEALRVLDRESPDETPKSDLGFLNWEFWRDRVAQITLIIAIVLNMALFAFLCASYNDLPALVPIHFDRYGIVDIMGPQAKLFVLPFLGLFAWMFNGALGWFFYQERRERPISLALWGAAVVVQLIAWIALLRLLAS